MIVVDAAAVVDALTLAPETSELRREMAADDLHAPALLDFEIVSALRGQTLASRLSAPRAEVALADFADLPLQRWDSAHPLRQRAFALRHTVSGYDAAYIALAEALDCPLITRDRRLARSHSHHARVHVH